MRAAGLTYDDFSKVEYLSFSESVELIKNRQLDVTLQSAGLGVASLRDLASSLAIVVVPIPADVVRKVGRDVYRPAVIPAGTYEGQTAGRGDGGDPERARDTRRRIRRTSSTG